MFSSIITSSRPFKISTENSIMFVESLPIDENFCFNEHLCAESFHAMLRENPQMWARSVNGHEKRYASCYMLQ